MNLRVRTTGREGVLIPGDRLFRRTSCYVDDRDLAECGIGKQHAGSGGSHTEKRRKADRSFGQRVSLPLAGLDSAYGIHRIDKIYVRERVFTGQYCMRRLFRAFEKRDVL